jgi:hypothetical protein
MQIGLHLLEDFVASKRKVILHVPDTNSAYSIPLFARPSFAINSPAPHVIEDDLLQAFARLDMQSNSFIDGRPIEYHLQMKDYGFDCITTMPVIFATVQEARKYYELVMRRLMHWISSVYHRRNDILKPSQGDQLPNRLSLRNEWTLDVEAKEEDGGILNRANAPSSISPETYAEKQMHLVSRPRPYSSSFRPSIQA